MHDDAATLLPGAIARHLIPPAVVLSLLGVAYVRVAGGLFVFVVPLLALLIAIACTVGFIPAVLLGTVGHGVDRDRLNRFAMVMGFVDATLSIVVYVVIRSVILCAAGDGGVVIFLIAPISSFLLSWHALRFCDRRGWLRRTIDLDHCTRCGYDISHSPGPVCPECGEPFPTEVIAAKSAGHEE